MIFALETHIYILNTSDYQVPGTVAFLHTQVKVKVINLLHSFTLPQGSIGLELFTAHLC